MQGDPYLMLEPAQIGNSSWEPWANRDLALVAGSGARAWLIRDPGFPLLVVVPDQRQQRELLSDLKSLFGPAIKASALPEIPLTQEGVKRKPIRIQRGEEFARWKRHGGILVATPGALLGPYSAPEGTFRLASGAETGRSTLIDWLSAFGYERVETVWSPGQFVVRGSIVDLFDPAQGAPVLVVHFLAMLELAREQLLEITQAEEFAPIYVRLAHGRSEHVAPD